MLTGSLFTLATLALASVASAKPIPAFNPALAKRSPPSFGSVLNFPGFSNFDNFYGVDNFAGISQTVVKDKTVVCQTQKIEIIQQYLAVIREYYKRIITQQVCHVEVQTVVHQQFVSSCSSFFDDIRRVSSRDVSFDHSIASQITSIHDSNGQCLTNDLGWNGLSIGSHSVNIQGSNWNSNSYIGVNQAYGQVQLAHGYSTSAAPSVVSSSPPVDVPSSCDSCDSSSSVSVPPPMVMSDSGSDSSSVALPDPSIASNSSDASASDSSDSTDSSDSSDSGLQLAPSNSTDSTDLSSKKVRRSRARFARK